MLHGEALGLLIGAVALGAVHGIEPGHGWPVAASYALDQANKWVYGFAASLILGVGHLISSIAMVLVFFYAKRYFDLTRVDEPIHLAGNVFLGGPVSIVAGILLLALGVREYQHGHSHGGPDGDHDHHDHSHHDHNHHDHNHHDHNHHDHNHHNHHDHDHDGGHSHDHGHARDHDHSHSDRDDGVLTRVKGYLPFGGGHAHSRERLDESANRGLLGIAWFAFVLGFAHEEEFEIIALCTGSAYCLELMFAYAITVIVGIVGLTMLLIAGYGRYEERVERYTPYLPAFSAVVLIVMGIGFITGRF